MMLTDMIGDAGKKIHKGRSRNYQVATDIKLYLKEEFQEIKNLVSDLFDLLISLRNQYKDVLMPG